MARERGRDEKGKLEGARSSGAESGGKDEFTRGADTDYGSLSKSLAEEMRKIPKPKNAEQKGDF